MRTSSDQGGHWNTKSCYSLTSVQDCSLIGVEMGRNVFTASRGLVGDIAINYFMPDPRKLTFPSVPGRRRQMVENKGMMYLEKLILILEKRKMNQTLLPNSSTLLHLLEIPRLMIFPTGMIRISTLRWMKEETTPSSPSWVYLIGRMCTIDIKVEVNLGATQKSLPVDASSIYGQAVLQPKSGLGGAGHSEGICYVSFFTN
ncbi:unnamed protein product [Fraxinus pennsylvanica]|uniref:Uncharacterized protein n=1 Tax=Fraxinus pennsylvanica TaxID=56036 RepID=A0AAD2A2Y1_9LAMI|nr:unnamed protein product [Fraxinus pennsylvanica]